MGMMLTVVERVTGELSRPVHLSVYMVDPLMDPDIWEPDLPLQMSPGGFVLLTVHDFTFFVSQLTFTLSPL